MALQPPQDFRPSTRGRVCPSERELRELWDRRESGRRERERRAEWRRVVEEVRRCSAGGLESSRSGACLPVYLGDAGAFGPRARGALRPEARRGRVAAAGVDTWSPCWYAEAGSGLARAMSVMATEGSGRARLMPEKVGGYRIGWFPDWGLVFGEGRPSGDALCGVGELPVALGRLEGAMEDVGLPVGSASAGGLRRLDVAADLWTGSGVEGLVFLECVGAASMGAGKIATYRGARCVESVLLKTRTGRSQGRVYDKGRESGGAPAGRWIRLEGQWRFQQGWRPLVGELSGGVLRDRFRYRFEPLWQASGGYGVGGLELVVRRVQAAMEAGQLRASRARSVVGYLVLSGGGVEQGAKRTTYELERECRELGLAVSVLEGHELRVDVATILEECMAGEVWGVG